MLIKSQQSVECVPSVLSMVKSDGGGTMQGRVIFRPGAGLSSLPRRANRVRLVLLCSGPSRRGPRVNRPVALLS